MKVCQPRHREPLELPQSIVSVEDLKLTLSSRAGPVDVLRGISLDIVAGQSVAIVGPSGSGKTSLLMVMAGLEKATGGRIEVAGRNLHALGADDLSLLRGAEIGIVFQSFHLMPTMTALENVALPLELIGAENATDMALSLLNDVGLGHRLHHYPSELSGGEQQRVAIARALVRRPRLILADEPTGNLDAQTGRQIVDLLFKMQARSHATLVLVTHDEKLAAASQRLVRMSDGRIVSDLLAGGRITSPELSAAVAP